MEPCLRTVDCRLYTTGELPKGIYVYTMVRSEQGCLTPIGSSTQVQAYHEKNSVYIYWDACNKSYRYLLFRSDNFKNRLKQYVEINTEDGLFIDDGTRKFIDYDGNK